METAITKGIKVSVETFFQPNYSKPVEFKHIFAYRITIENMSGNIVQLLRRHWYILDSNGLQREVEGEGIVGQQPVLNPGEKHQYISWCSLITDVGKMWGTYLMQNKRGGQCFKVDIPAFNMIAPFKSN